jgi:hypothetical protein
MSTDACKQIKSKGQSSSQRAGCAVALNRGIMCTARGDLEANNHVLVARSDDSDLLPVLSIQHSALFSSEFEPQPVPLAVLYQSWNTNLT